MLNVSAIVPVENDSPLVSIHLFRDATYQLRYETYVEHLLSSASNAVSAIALHRVLRTASCPASLAGSIGSTQ